MDGIWLIYCFVQALSVKTSGLSKTAACCNRATDALLKLDYRGLEKPLVAKSMRDASVAIPSTCPPKFPRRAFGRQSQFREKLLCDPRQHNRPFKA